MADLMQFQKEFARQIINFRLRSDQILMLLPCYSFFMVSLSLQSRFNLQLLYFTRVEQKRAYSTFLQIE